MPLNCNQLLNDEVQTMCVLLGHLLHVFVHPLLWLGVKEDLITRLLSHYESVSVGFRVISMVWALNGCLENTEQQLQCTKIVFKLCVA